MKLNNKGFAISTVMYIILIIALVLIVSILGMLSSRKMTLDKVKDAALTEVKSRIFVKTYNVGDKIKVAGEYYYVISRSPRRQDYVTALKEKPLTKQEIERYGQGHINRNSRWDQGVVGEYRDSNGMQVNPQYGSIVFYSSDTCGNNGVYSGCTNEYDESDIKYVVDGWSNDLLNDKLKSVNGYKARLLKSIELKNNLGCVNNDNNNTCIDSPYNWVYNMSFEFNIYSYNYILMDGYNSPSESLIYYVEYNYNSNYPISLGSVWSSSGAVRPVINVYKSAIEEE